MFYITFRSEIVVMMENLFQMPHKNCMSAFVIYKKAAKQANQLCEFYDWCKAMGLCGTYEYPFVDRIPHVQVKALETFINGMWQFTDSSTSSSSQSTVEDCDYKVAQLEDDVSWETLLDCSVNLSPNHQRMCLHDCIVYDDGVQVVNPFINTSSPWGL